MWFSETGDIWGDNDGSFAAGKRTLCAGPSSKAHRSIS